MYNTISNKKLYIVSGKESFSCTRDLAAKFQRQGPQSNRFLKGAFVFNLSAFHQTYSFEAHLFSYSL